MKKWKCTVCGYIHTGDEPPEKCPVCGADRSKFVEITDEQAAPVEKKPVPVAPVDRPTAPVSSPQTLLRKLTGLMVKHHAHPISVHIPNGVVPVSAVFVVLAVFFNIAELAQAAFYNTAFVLLTMPVVIFTGYQEWRQKYGGHLTMPFLVKMISGAVVTLCAIVLVFWHMVNPTITATGSSGRMSYLLVNLIMLGAAGAAGFFGGKLVFRD